jgi:hypothetical protein
MRRRCERNQGNPLWEGSDREESELWTHGAPKSFENKPTVSLVTKDIPGSVSGTNLPFANLPLVTRHGPSVRG